MTLTSSMRLGFVILLGFLNFTAYASIPCGAPGNDFVIGIDASKSVASSGWTSEVNFVNGVIDYLTGLGVGHRIALYYFNKPAIQIHDFSSSRSSLRSALSSLSYTSIRDGSTNHPAGYAMAEEYFSRSSAAQNRKIHILVTDGEPHKSTNLCANPSSLPCTSACNNEAGEYCDDSCKCSVYSAQNFNKKYTTLVASVPNTNHPGLSFRQTIDGLASSSYYHTMASSFADLENRVSEVAQKACPPPPPPTPSPHSHSPHSHAPHSHAPHNHSPHNHSPHSHAPTAYPTAFPTAFPSAFPTAHTHTPHNHEPHSHEPHSHTPTVPPTAFPTAFPTASPTASPTAYPTSSVIYVVCLDGADHTLEVDLVTDSLEKIKERIALSTMCGVPTEQQVIELVPGIGPKTDGGARLLCDANDSCETTMLEGENVQNLNTLVLKAETRAPTSPPTKYPTAFPTIFVQDCTNGVRDGDETDVDCGGETCPLCANGLVCVDGERDCASGNCDPDEADICHADVEDGGDAVVPNRRRRLSAVENDSDFFIVCGMEFFYLPWGGVVKAKWLESLEIRIEREGGTPAESFVTDTSGEGFRLMDEEVNVKWGSGAASASTTATLVENSMTLSFGNGAKMPRAGRCVAPTQAPTRFPTIYPTPAPTSSIIYVICPDGSEHEMEVDLLDHVEVVQGRIAADAICGVPIDDQVVQLVPGDGPESEGGAALGCDADDSCDSTTLTDEGVEHLNTLVLLEATAAPTLYPTKYPTETAFPTAYPTVSIIYVICADGSDHSIEVDLENDTLEKIKKDIASEEMCGVPVEDQVVEWFAGEDQDGSTVLGCDRDDSCETTSLADEGVDHLNTLVLKATPSPTTLPPTKYPTRYPTEFVQDCSNNVRDGDETDVDCGGETCEPCDEGSVCVVGERDCETGFCDLSQTASECEDSPPSNLPIRCGMEFFYSPWGGVVVAQWLSTLELRVARKDGSPTEQWTTDSGGTAYHLFLNDQVDVEWGSGAASSTTTASMDDLTMMISLGNGAKMPRAGRCNVPTPAPTLFPTAYPSASPTAYPTNSVIYVVCPDAGEHTLEVDLSSDTLESVKDRIAADSICGIPVDEQLIELVPGVGPLTEGGTPLQCDADDACDSTVLEGEGVEHLNTLVLIASTDEPTMSPTKFPTNTAFPTAFPTSSVIYVVCADGAEHTLEVDLDIDSLEKIKERIAAGAVCGVPTEQQVLEHVPGEGPEVEGGARLRCDAEDACDSTTLLEEGVEHLNTLVLLEVTKSPTLFPTLFPTDTAFPTAYPTSSVIYVVCADGTEHTLEVDLDNDSLEMIKGRIATDEICDVPVEEQIITHVLGEGPNTVGGSRLSCDADDSCESISLEGEGVEHLNTLVLGSTPSPTSPAPTLFPSKYPTAYVASCTNEIRDGDETDVDCGGIVCSPCDDGLVCVDGERDCDSGYCDFSKTEIDPECADGPSAALLVKCGMEFFYAPWGGVVVAQWLSSLELRVAREGGKPSDRFSTDTGGRAFQFVNGEEVVALLGAPGSTVETTASLDVDSLTISLGNGAMMPRAGRCDAATEAPTFFPTRYPSSAPTPAPTSSVLFVICPDGSEHTLEVSLDDDTVRSVQQRIADAGEMCGVPVVDQLLEFVPSTSGKPEPGPNRGPLECEPCQADATLGDAALDHLNTLLLSAATPYPTGFPTTYPTSSVIYVVCADGSEHTLAVDLATDTVQTIKARISAKEVCGVPEDDQFITYVPGEGPSTEGGSDLGCDKDDSCDNTYLEDEGVEHLETLVLHKSTDAPTRFPTAFPTASVIYVICVDGAEHTLEVDLGAEYVTEIKRRVAEKCDVPEEGIEIDHVPGIGPSDEGGAPLGCDVDAGGTDSGLCDETTLEEDGIEHFNTLVVRETPTPTRVPTAYPTQYPTEPIPKCLNLVRDGDETDVDCGGTDCPPCEDGLVCVEGVRDCESGYCDLMRGESCSSEAATSLPIKCGAEFFYAPWGGVVVAWWLDSKELRVKREDGEASETFVTDTGGKGYRILVGDDVDVKWGEDGGSGGITAAMDDNAPHGITLSNGANMPRAGRCSVATATPSVSPTLSPSRAPTAFPTSSVIYVVCAKSGELGVACETENPVANNPRNQGWTNKCFRLGCDADKYPDAETCKAEACASKQCSRGSKEGKSIVDVSNACAGGDCCKKCKGFCRDGCDEYFSPATFTLKVDLGDTVEMIKERIASEEMCNIPTEQQVIEHVLGDGPKTDGGSELSCDADDSCETASLDEEGVQHLNTLVLAGTAAPTFPETRYPSAYPTAAPTASRLWVVCSDGEEHLIEVDLGTDTVADAKSKVAEACDVPLDELPEVWHVPKGTPDAPVTDGGAGLVCGEGGESCTLNEEDVLHYHTLVLRATPAPTPDPTNSPTKFPTEHVPSCANNLRDGDETDTDCGGGTCPPCEDGLVCEDGDRDCVGGYCDFVPLYETAEEAEARDPYRVCPVDADYCIRSGETWYFGPWGPAFLRSEWLEDGELRIGRSLRYGLVTATGGKAEVLLQGDDVDISWGAEESDFKSARLIDERTLRISNGRSLYRLSVCHSTHSPTISPTRFPTAYPTASVIYVICLDASEHTLEVDLEGDTIDAIKERIELLCDVGADEMAVDYVPGKGPSDEGGARFLCEEADACDDVTLDDEGVKNLETLVLRSTHSPTPSPTLFPSASPTTVAPTRESCSNGIMDEAETDVDCGGPSCERCEDEHTCEVDADCLSTFCAVVESEVELEEPARRLNDATGKVSTELAQRQITAYPTAFPTPVADIFSNIIPNSCRRRCNVHFV